MSLKHPEVSNIHSEQFIQIILSNIITTTKNSDIFEFYFLLNLNME